MLDLLLQPLSHVAAPAFLPGSCQPDTRPLRQACPSAGGRAGPRKTAPLLSSLPRPPRCEKLRTLVCTDSPSPPPTPLLSTPGPTQILPKDKAPDFKIMHHYSPPNPRLSGPAPVIQKRATQRAVLGPAAWAPPDSLLEMQNPGLHSRPPASGSALKVTPL